MRTESNSSMHMHLRFRSSLSLSSVVYVFMYWTMNMVSSTYSNLSAIKQPTWLKSRSPLHKKETPDATAAAAETISAPKHRQ